MKRLLFVTLYYFPENGSSDYYLADLKKYLLNQGNIISTVAPNPVRDLCAEDILKYKNILFERNNDMDVYRLYCGANNGFGIFRRLLRLRTFKRKLKVFFKQNHSKFDCVYIPSNPPIFIPLMLEKLCKKYNVKSVYSVTDIWPQIMGKYGFLSGLAKKAILNADRVATLSNDMKDTIYSLSGRKDVEIIRIWPDYSIYENTLAPDFDYSQFNKEKFNVFYIGNIGYFQNVDLLLDVAKKMKSDDRYHFYIVGSGRRKNVILDRIKNESINNVSFINRVSNQVASSLYKIADLNIISLQKSKILYACPSKTSTCIYSKKPCLLLLDQSRYSEELIEEHSNFFINNTFDVDDIAKSIRHISKMKITASDISENEIYKKETNLEKWNKVLTGGE